MEKSNYTLGKTCRTCAENSSKRLSPLFKEESILLVQFFHNKEYRIEISKGDGLPQNICSKCEKKFSKIKNFLKKCEETQNILVQKFNEREELNTILEFNDVDDLKSEYVSDKDEPFCDSDNPENCFENASNTDIIVEKINPVKLEVKTENECTEKSFSKINTEPEGDVEGKDQILASNNDADCDMSSSQRKTRSNSKRNLNQKPNNFNCIVCNENFDNFAKWKKHKKLHPQIKKAIKETFLCDHCGKEFVKQDGLKDHMNTHLGLKPYKCEICGKCFAVKNALRSHAGNHAKSETYTCDTCGKVFTTKTYFRDHCKRHEKGLILENCERLYKCPFCTKSFKLLSTLTAHCNFHSKPSDRKYQCTMCETTFKRSDHLKEHINGVHLNIKPFKCETCSKAFVTRALRNAHANKYHTGLRYKCNICDKDFSIKDTLARHQRIHTGDKRFVCEICNMSFMKVYQIEKHMEIHTIDEETKNSLISQTYERITKGILGTNQK